MIRNILSAGRTELYLVKDQAKNHELDSQKNFVA